MIVSTSDAFPLYVSCYVCHYNVPAVHNELQNPTPKRVNWWLRSTTVSATMFYMLIGIAGSTYGHCIPTGKVQGNILLDFDEHDPLLLVARMCLACTLTLAFPLLVIPARDILLRSWFATSTTTTTVSVTSTTHHHHHHRHNQRHPTTNNAESSNTAPTTTEEVLREPLLANEQREENVTEEEEEVDDDSSETVTARATATAAARSVVSQPQQHSFSIRLGAAILVLWSAAALASCVKSIDIVWDLLGSSLSIFLSYLIPCGTFVVIVGRLNSGADGDMEDGSSGGDNEDEDEEDAAVAAGSSGKWKRKVALTVAWVLIGIYIPLMLISSANAIYGTFFS